MQELDSECRSVLNGRIRRFSFLPADVEVYLLSTSQLSIEDFKRLLPEAMLVDARERYKSETRRFEFLATRLLLRAVLGSGVEIAYHPTGRPYLRGNVCSNISVSHTDGYVAIALSVQRVGLDVERITLRQLRLRHRFMSPAECEQAERFASPEQAAAIAWSAKEALYKLVDVPGTDLLDGLACEWCSAQVLRDVQRGNEVLIRMCGDLVIAVAYEKWDSSSRG